MDAGCRACSTQVIVIFALGIFLEDNPVLAIVRQRVAKVVDGIKVTIAIVSYIYVCDFSFPEVCRHILSQHALKAIMVKLRI